jgi:hypothetical protein
MTPTDSVSLSALGGLVAWLLVVWVSGRVIRPRRVTPAPATPELDARLPTGPGQPPLDTATISPAVVNLLVNRGRLTGDAVRATLLDLAARDVIELYQPGDDPLRPLVRLRRSTPPDLLPHEERVLARVRAATTVPKWVPLAELANQYAKEGRSWQAEFRREVRRAAKKAGLTNDFFSMFTAVILAAGALVAGMLVAVPLTLLWPAQWTGPAPTGSPAFDGTPVPDGTPLPTPTGTGPGQLATVGVGGALCCLWAVLMLVFVFVLFALHDRDGLTDRGRRVTAHFLGVVGWLAAHPQLRELPTASVTVWDRYLSYGVALGLNPAAARPIDLRTGDAETLWTIRGSRWHQLTVRHPAAYRPYGLPAGVTLAWSVAAIPLWLVAAGWAAQVWRRVETLTGHVLAGLLVAAGLALAVRAGAGVVRAVVDLLAPVTVAGRVVSITPVTFRDSLRPSSAPGEHPGWRRERWVYLVLDDGRQEVLRPWRIGQSRLAGAQVGDRIVLRGQRFGRYAAAARPS